jgi:signal transduction histidine kinase
VTPPPPRPSPWQVRGAEHLRRWAVPGLLTAAQAGLWSAEIPSPVPRTPAALAVAIAVLLGSVLSLGARLRNPERALAGALLAAAAAYLWQDQVHATLAETECVLVALYSCAVRLDPRRSLSAAAVATAGLAALQPLTQDTGTAGLLLVVTQCAAAVGAGLTRRHWRDERLRSSQEMGRAATEEQQAAAAERDRLARELHDVTAHHLTSVVVTADAAGRLGERRPELVVEAAEFSARTGRETITALRRLVALLNSEQEPDSGLTTADIEQLVAGFSRLGRPIVVRLAPDLAGLAATAAHGIVREALTNALRYAPGAAVSVRVERVGTDLEVEIANGAPRLSPSHGVSSVGSGRGLTGMRQRAESVGGTVSAGPDDDGGWVVRAALPDPSGPLAPPDARRRNFPAEQRAADAAVAGAVACAAPAAVTLLAPGSATAWLTAALCVLQALPLLWRRRAPWAVTVVCLVTTVPYPALTMLGVTTVPAWAPLVCGMLVGSTTVYAVGAYGRQPTGPSRLARAVPTWPAVLLTAVVHTVLVTATALADGDIDGYRADIFTGTYITLLVAAGLVTVLGAAGTSGWAMYRYRLRVVLREDGVVQASRWQKEAAAHAERARMAAGLEKTVLHHTGEMIAHAENGRLEQVADEARKALAGMRALLDGLRRTQQSAALAPQRTTADLEVLCRENRARGRPVVLHRSPGATDELPGDVDLAAFHIVEACLSAAGSDTVHVTVWREPGMLRIATGLSARKAARRVGTHCAAVHGGLLVAPDGIVYIWLPVGRHGDAAGVHSTAQTVPDPAGQMPTSPVAAPSSADGL